MRTGQGFFLVYDITSYSSFDEIHKFHEQILRIKDTNKVPAVLVGNKVDLEARREVDAEDGKEFAKKIGAPFLETSAKTRFNIEESFAQLVKEIRKQIEPQDKGGKAKKEKKKKDCSIL
jgi:GTPase KRas protein